MYQKDQVLPMSNQTVQEVLQFPCLAIPERNIGKFTCEQLGFRTECSTTDGKPIAHYFPVTRKGKITGFKKRDLTKPKKHKWHFSAIGDVKVDCELINQSNCKSGLKLYITEGEYDLAATWQTLYYDQQQKGKYTPQVVSIPLGTANAGEAIANNLHFLNSFKTKISVFDNDEASAEEAKKGIKRGKEATRDVASLVPDLKTVLIPHEHNDPSNYMLHDHKELYKLLSFGIQAYHPEDIVKGSLDPEELYKPLEEGIAVKCMPKTSAALHGIRAGEFTLILAPAGAGKTTLVKEIGLDLAERKDSILDWIMIEEDAKKTQQSLIAMDNNIPLPRFRADPRILAIGLREASRAKLIDNNRSYFVDAKASFGYMNSARLMERLRWGATRGVTHVLLDHLTMVFYGDSKVQDIDSLLIDIAAFCNSTGVHVIGVSHITRKNRAPPKGQHGGILYPYWEEVRKEDARGAGSFEQCGWNIITVEPEILESGDRGRIRLRVDKNREWGLLGLTDILEMNEETGRLEPAGALEIH